MLISTNIIFFYTEVMPYTVACLDEIGKKVDGEIHVVYWDRNKLTPFCPLNSKNVYFHPRSKFENVQSLKSIIEIYKPSIIYISGWVDKDYLKAVKYAKSNKVKIVTGLDNQYKGTFRQWINKLFSWYFLKPYFTHVWVPGRLQYEYARFLGFPHKAIIYNLYSANTEFFSSVSIDRKYNSHTILFVGRFHKNKGIDLLCEAFTRYKKENQNNWTLHLIGNGPLKGTIVSHPDIKVSDFMNTENLAKEAINAAIFCLPSRIEPWGVVIQEFAAAGLPLITSDICGANSEFLINGYNGFTFKNEDADDLMQKLKLLTNLPDDELFSMGQASSRLANRISPEQSAANFLSLIK